MIRLSIVISRYEEHDKEGGRLARVEDARAHATAREHPANARSAFQEENDGEGQDGARKAVKPFGIGEIAPHNPIT